jgi:nucleotide-binding universal stress UspA family protein
MSGPGSSTERPSSVPRRPVARNVVVGVDGSEQSLAAVDLAAREAALRHYPLHVVHAFVWPLMRVPLGPPEGMPAGGLLHEAERIVDEAIDLARTTAPGLAVTGEVAVGGAAPVLLRCAAAAGLVVVGDRGLGGFTGLLLGSVAVQLAAHAACPVLVARGSPRSEGPVLLGVDGSPAADSAVGFAFEAASLHHVPVEALHAWRHPVSTGPGDLVPLVYEPAEVRDDEERLLSEALAGWSQRYPDVAVRRVLPRESARSALVEASGHARLVVVGARGRGGMTGLLLGSVSQAVLHHAACPVAIVRHAGA